jgi:hypothetical protein
VIIFWIFTLFVGSTAFAFALIWLQLGIGWSLAEALIAQGELVGDEISGLLDSVGLREPAAVDPYPPELPMVPDMRAPIAVSEPA